MPENLFMKPSKIEKVIDVVNICTKSSCRMRKTEWIKILKHVLCLLKHSVDSAKKLRPRGEV